jgi:pimeloyl-ACP methyl ester carboxylesterase
VHENLDSHMDWLIATHDLVASAGTSPVDLVGISIGAALAADVAALWPGLVRRLVLVSPLGVNDPADPPIDIFAQPPGGMDAAMTVDPATFKRHMARPEGVDELEWQIVALRASEAAARVLWPLGDTGLARRMHRIVAPTLVVAGEKDKVLPRGAAQKFARRLGGKSSVKGIASAGHLADLDAPEELARLVLAHCGAASVVRLGARTKRKAPRATSSRAGASRAKVKRAKPPTAARRRVAGKRR